jgi:hypothetical protein
MSLSPQPFEGKEGLFISGIGLVVFVLVPVYSLIGIAIWFGLMGLLWALNHLAEASARLGDRIFGPRHKPEPAPEPVVFKDDLNAIDPIELDHWEPASRFEVVVKDDFGPPRRRRRRSRGRGRF